MTGVIAITDWDWFQFLSAQEGLDEVNFWRPSDTETPRIAPGTPIIFKLRRRHGDWIVGFGIFARHSVLPAWMAWEAFERGNGAESFEAMRSRIERIRRVEADVRGGGQYAIGCLMLSAPVFFERADWIHPPSDWSPNIVQGKSYDLSMGEGARIWERCQALALARPRIERFAGATAEPAAPRYGETVLVRPRLGQGTFRIAVTDAYGRACAVTTEHSLPVLEAAHIRPFSLDGPHEVSNGLLLRTDIHRLFDKGYVTVTPDHRFEVSRRLRDDYENGRTYYELHGRSIELPRILADRPGREHLEWHAREVFKG